MFTIDQTAKLWFSDEGTRCFANYTGHGGSVNSISIWPESIKSYGTNSQLTVLTASGDRTAHIWRVNLEEIRTRMPSFDKGKATNSSENPELGNS